MTPLKIVSKIFIAIFSLLSVFLILTDWIELGSPYLSGNSSIFDIANLLLESGEFFDQPLLAFIGFTFMILAVSAIILFIVGTIVSLASREAGGVSKSAGILALVLTTIFFVLLFYANAELEDALYYHGGMIFEPTQFPVLLLITSVTVVVFASILSSNSSPAAVSYTPVSVNRSSFCPKCGYSLTNISYYCPNCSQPLNNSGTVRGLNNIRDKAHEDDLLRRGGWRCTRCGKVQPSYTGTCSCGNVKSKN